MVLGAPHLAEAPMVNHRQHDRVEWREVVAARSDDGATGEQQRQPLSRHHVSKRIEMIVLKHRPSGSGSAGYRPPPADPPEAADLPEKKMPRRHRGDGQGKALKANRVYLQRCTLATRAARRFAVFQMPGGPEGTAAAARSSGSLIPA
jgi:hypothetical protein